MPPVTGRTANANQPLFPKKLKSSIDDAIAITPREPVQRETVVGSMVRPEAISGVGIATEVVASEETVTQLPPSYSWGSPTKGNWQQTQSTDKVNVGDVLRFTHKLKIPFLQQWQTDHAISKFQEDQRFQLLYFALNEETRTLIIEARAMSSFSPVPLIAAAVVIILAGAFVWVTTISIERLGTVSIAGTKFNLAPLLVFGILAIVGLGLLKGSGILRAAGSLRE